MAHKATAHDGELILKLYDLRREAELRKARSYMVAEFWPQNADDVVKLVNSFPGQENAWMRQVLGYWDIAASLVLHGALHQDLFLEPGFSGEMFFILGKIYPLLKETRGKLNNAQLLANVEKVATSTKASRKRLELSVERAAARSKALAKKPGK